MEEIWKDIDGYPDYKVSNFGRVLSSEKQFEFYTRRARLIKIRIKNNGYAAYALYRNKVAKTISVHRLVAQAFIPNIENKPEVNHKDLNKLNNYSSNLEWATRRENVDHVLLHERFKAKLSNSDVAHIRKRAEGVTARNFNNLIAKEYNVSSSHIKHIRNHSTRKGKDCYPSP